MDRLKRVTNGCASYRARNESEPTGSATGSAAGVRVLLVSKRFPGGGQKPANWRHELAFSTLTTLAIATQQRLNTSVPLSSPRSATAWSSSTPGTAFACDCVPDPSQPRECEIAISPRGRPVFSAVQLSNIPCALGSPPGSARTERSQCLPLHFHAVQLSPVNRAESLLPSWQKRRDRKLSRSNWRPSQPLSFIAVSAILRPWCRAPLSSFSLGLRDPSAPAIVVAPYGDPPVISFKVI
jgi:hypothetical protein